MFNKSVDRCEDVLMARHVVESIRTIFLDPVCLSVVVTAAESAIYHGRLSSASIGRSATIRFPLATVFSELN